MLSINFFIDLGMSSLALTNGNHFSSRYKKKHNLPSLISGTNGNQNFCQLEGKLGGIEKVAAKHSLSGSTESQLLHYNFIFGDFKGKSI